MDKYNTIHCIGTYNSIALINSIALRIYEIMLRSRLHTWQKTKLYVSTTIENIARKGEIVVYKQFHLLPHCFLLFTDKFVTWLALNLKSFNFFFS